MIPAGPPIASLIPFSLQSLAILHKYFSWAAAGRGFPAMPDVAARVADLRAGSEREPRRQVSRVAAHFG